PRCMRVVHSLRESAPCGATALEESIMPRQNGGMIAMTEPQVWTVIGVLAAALTGMIAVTTQLMMRTFSAQFETVAQRFSAMSERLDDRFTSIDGRFESMERRFESMDKRF